MSNTGSNLKLVLNDNSLFSFSSILSVKYPKGRIVPSQLPQNLNQYAKKPSLSSNIITMHQSYQLFPPSIIDRNISTHEHFEKENSNQSSKYFKNNHSEFSRIIPYIATLLGVALAIGIAAVLVTTLYKPASVTTIIYAKRNLDTTTTTITTYTSATTTTSTTSTTTSISTSSTSTSSASTTSTSSTSTTSTSSTSTTITTTTTTTTTTTSGCYYVDDYVNLVEGGRRRIGNLKVGDRVWTLSKDGKQFIEDEIILILHTEPNSTIYFYTFITIEGHTISLSGSHNIIVVIKNEKNMKFLRASKVTLEHQLVLIGRSIKLKQILHTQRKGFYAPLTFTSYLLVNNISTSVYTDSFRATHDFLHRVFSPIRIYYRIARWLFGNDYNPFATVIKEGLHPLTNFIIINNKPIRLFFTILPFILPFLSTILLFYLTRQMFLFEMNCYISSKK